MEIKDVINEWNKLYFVAEIRQKNISKKLDEYNVAIRVDKEKIKKILNFILKCILKEHDFKFGKEKLTDNSLLFLEGDEIYKREYRCHRKYYLDLLNTYRTQPIIEEKFNNMLEDIKKILGEYEKECGEKTYEKTKEIIHVEEMNIKVYKKGDYGFEEDKIETQIIKKNEIKFRSGYSYKYFINFTDKNNYDVDDNMLLCMNDDIHKAKSRALGIIEKHRKAYKQNIESYEKKIENIIKKAGYMYYVVLMKL